MNNMKKPKIRFKGFTDDWEQRKVGEVIEDYVEKTTVQNQYPVLTSSQQQGIVLQEDYFADRQVTTNDNVGYYVLPRGYFTYRSRSDTDLFVFNRNNLIDKGIISYYYPVFRPKNADSNFLLRRLNNGIRSQVSMAAEGTGQHVLAHSKLKNMELLVPSVPEQKLIGAYFEILDNLITLHQRKYEKLQIIKKSMLENCFPKNGEKVPKIRFSGFTGDWEQCKLSEMVGMTYGGGTPSTANDTFWYGDIPWIQSSNVVEDELFNVDIKKHISRDGLNHSAAQLVPENSVAVVTHVGVGKLVFMPYSYTTSQDFISLGDMKCEPRFLCYALYKRLQEDLHIVQGSAIKGITKEDLMNKLISVPQITEQTKIANTLQGLDHLITLHQSELEKLQKIKKSLLERMFV